VYDVTKLEPGDRQPTPGQQGDRTEEGHELDRAYIGVCTGGKLTDFKVAAGIMNGEDGEVTP